MKHLLSAFLLLASVSGTAQIKTSDLSFLVGPTATRIKNENILDDNKKVVDNKNGLNVEFSYNKYRGGVGLGIGIGYATYNNAIIQKGKFESFSQTDIDGNTYDEWIDSDITYTNKLSYINVPVTLHLLFGRQKNFHVIVDIGVVGQFLASGTSTMKGSIENMGRYETSNPYFSVVSQGNSYYDYKLTYYDEKLSDQFRKFNVSGHFAVGLGAMMTENLRLKVLPFADLGLMDVTTKAAQGNDYVNVFGRKSKYEKTTILAVGIQIGFAYNIGNVGVN